jgi:hypothetical protein
MSKFPLSFLLFFLAVALVVAQAECPELVQTALEAAEAQCAAAGRNQICYGHTALTVEAQPDATNFAFETIGDITDVAAIQRLQLAGLDAKSGIWGVVLMKLQANIPNTLPGQNVTVMLFGDSEIRNAASSVAEQVPPEQERTVNASQSINVRELPSTAGRVLGSIAPTTAVTATGRTADSQWIRVRFGEQTGWVSASLLSGADITELMPVEPDAPQFGPMQAFYFTTGIGQTNCDEVPGDGMLVQTPTGVGSIDLTVNEVQVNMGSTGYFTMNANRELAVYSLEGGVRVTANGRTRTSVEGTRVRIPLDEDLSVEGEPFEIESYADNETLEYLPIDALERDIEIEEPLDDEELELYQQYAAVFDNINIEDVDEVFDYIDENWDDADFNIADYLVEELDYTDFDDELESYFEDELGYDLDDFGDDTDDFGDDTNDDSDDTDDGSDDSGNDAGADGGTDDSADDSGSDDSGGDDGGDDSGE